LQDQIRALQQQRNMPAMGMAESRRQVTESEVQQAQVVLAAQDMVDEVQKMSEQVSAMQFKDLPALVDQIKNQVGPDQATQFNGDASAALSALLQNLQASKQQLDQALGVVTGQAPAIPGEAPGMDASMAGEMPAELPAPGEEEIATDVEVDDVEDSDTLATSLGRDRR
jgi:ABC-type phosphate transport system auxiliary subunit